MKKILFAASEAVPFIKTGGSQRNQKQQIALKAFVVFSLHFILAKNYIINGRDY